MDGEICAKVKKVIRASGLEAPEAPVRGWTRREEAAGRISMGKLNAEAGRFHHATFVHGKFDRSIWRGDPLDRRQAGNRLRVVCSLPLAHEGGEDLCEKFR